MAVEGELLYEDERGGVWRHLDGRITIALKMSSTEMTEHAKRQKKTE